VNRHRGDNGEDCHGHGTHVAGIVGGVKSGVAKRVLLRGVKVVRCDGWGSVSATIAAVDWLRANHTSPAVANMSLGWPHSAALNKAVNALAAFTTASAGSSLSPDAKAPTSNWGSCVDGYAPGYAIMSARLGGGMTSKSGTSMASPHVAGVGALIKQAYGNRSSSWITTTIKTSATPNVIEGNPSGTSNRLLFKDTL
jgi:subtilisin family serine protease